MKVRFLGKKDANEDPLAGDDEKKEEGESPAKNKNNNLSHDKLMEIATILKKTPQNEGGIKIQDRMYHLKTYKKCFVASEAIDTMIRMKFVKTREDAVDLGRQLQNSIGLWHHVCDDHQFKDTYLFFRFTESSESESGSGGVVDDIYDHDTAVDGSSSKKDKKNDPQQKQRSFDDDYESGEKCGSGAFAKVFVGINKKTRQEFAVKQIMNRSQMRFGPDRDMLLDEIDNLKALREAPAVVYLKDFYDGDPTCYLVMELLRGGELFHKLVEKNIFTEDEAKESCKCVLEALAYMHQKRIVHRDLKPENLMLANDDLRSVKVCDFGFSKVVITKNALTTRCGTPGYMAPEMLEKWPGYDVKCDVWSYGVIMFFLLSGVQPFDPPGATDKDCMELTRAGNFHFTPSRWKDLSFESKDLVACCLKLNPIRRIDSKTALEHAWFKSMEDDNSQTTKKRSTRISAINLSAAILEMEPRKKQRENLTKGPKTERVDRLNEEFDRYLQFRKADSLISLLTGDHDASSRITNNISSRIIRSGSDDGDGVCGQFNSIYLTFEEDSPTGGQFKEFYSFQDTIKIGSFGSVSRYKHHRTGCTFAVKQVSSERLNDHQMKMLQQEINILKYLRGAPHIIRLFDVFDEWENTYLIMDEMKGGDLLDRLTDKSVYTEREARDLGRSLFEAVKYMHGKKIAHRDIKLDNLLLMTKGCDASIKLADFGFANRDVRGNGFSTFCGTSHYMAPEIYLLKESGKRYDCLCDMWSAGVVMYALLSGSLPFNEKSVPASKAKITKGEFTFHDEDWKSRPSAKFMVSKMLEVDPRKRMTAEQALECEWMGLDEERLNVCDLSIAKERMLKTKENARKEKRTLEVENPSIVGGRMGCIQIQTTEIDGNSAGAEEPFENHYRLGDESLNTLFGTIFLATCTKTGVQYSVKKVTRRKLNPCEAAAVNDEIAVLKIASECSQVIDLFEVYDDADTTTIVMEHINGQPLVDQLIERESFNEFDAKAIARSLLSGIEFLHKNRIANRNLTLESLILLDGTESVKMFDFEFAKKVVFPNSLHTQCGTQEYLAPEVLAHSPAYDVGCDMWSVGVVLFLLLGGYYPFRGDTEESTLKNSRYGRFIFKLKYWKHISGDAKSLIKRLLQADPDERATASEALASSWMLTSDNPSASADLSSNMKELRISINKTLLAQEQGKNDFVRLKNNRKSLRKSFSPRISISRGDKAVARISGKYYGS